MPSAPRPDWGLRATADDLVARYVEAGWWTGDTLGTTVAAAVERLEDVTFAVHSRHRPWRSTFGEVDHMARSLAASLEARGVGPGSVVVFQLPNWVEAAVTFWGAAYLGAVVVPVVHFYGPKEVGYVIDTVRPDIVITPARLGTIDYLANLDPLLAGDDRWYVAGAADRGSLPAGAHAFEELLGADPIAGPLPADAAAPAVVGFTSGTTRHPKGVVHSHRTLLCEARQLHAMTRSDSPPSLVGAPVGHFIGMLSAFLVPLLREAPINLVDVWDPAEVLRIMRAEHLNLSGGATFFITSLLDHPDCTDEHVELMPHAWIGGSAVPVAVSERLTARGINVYRSYGSTEHPSITGSTIGDPTLSCTTTDGSPLDGVEVRLGHGGEILTRGPDLFLGYTDPELTAQVFDDDGWYHTGDIGALDDAGFLTITDRVSDIIIRGGENISAQEVEELLLTMPAIAEVAVVAAPDERMGERAAAVIRAQPGASAPTLDELRAHLAEAGLAKQKWPESIHPVSDLPRTPSGKVQKFRLRTQLREGTLEHALDQS